METDTGDSLTSRTRLVDAAETLMREDGYAAVTTRRVAAKAGLKPQLVHYHFRTMDALFRAVFRRMAEEILSRQREAEHSATPLREMWNIHSDDRYRMLIYEFVALGNHRKALQTEFITFGDELRQMQIALMTRVLAAHRIDHFPWTPAFAAIVLHGLARFLALESELGVSEGHAAAQAIVQHFIQRYDGFQPSLEQRYAMLEAENAELRRKLNLPE